MILDALAALTAEDENAARRVIAADDAVDYDFNDSQSVSYCLRILIAVSSFNRTDRNCSPRCVYPAVR